MPPEGLHAYEYSLLRVVPRADRGERCNAGVVLWCRSLEWLGAAVDLDEHRVRCLDPGADLDAVRAQLDAVVRVCRGGDGAGPAGSRPPGERFRWLVAPRSTAVRPSGVHGGLTADPAAELERLLAALVRPLGPAGG